MLILRASPLLILDDLIWRLRQLEVMPNVSWLPATFLVTGFPLAPRLVGQYPRMLNFGRNRVSRLHKDWWRTGIADARWSTNQNNVP